MHCYEFNGIGKIQYFRRNLGEASEVYTNKEASSSVFSGPPNVSDMQLPFDINTIPDLFHQYLKSDNQVSANPKRMFEVFPFLKHHLSLQVLNAIPADRLLQFQRTSYIQNQLLQR